MPFNSPVSPEQTSGTSFIAHPQDPLYDAEYYINDAGLTVTIKPNGKLKLDPPDKIPPELDKLLKSDPITKNRLINRYQPGKGPDLQDKLKYFYQEHAYPLEPWAPFQDPKTTPGEAAASALMMGQEWANPAAKGAGRMIEKGAERGLDKILPYLIKSEPVRRAVTKLGSRVAPELLRAGITAGGGAAANAATGNSALQGAESGLEMEGMRGALKAVPHGVRFANRYATQAGEALKATEPPALSILHHPEFDLTNPKSYLAQEYKSKGRNWIQALRGMGWKDFAKIFGERYSDGMATLPDSMVWQARLDAADADKAFKAKYNLKPGTVVQPSTFTAQMQRDWQAVLDAQKGISEAQKNGKKVAALTEKVRKYNDQNLFDTKGEKRKGKAELFDQIANAKSEIRRLLVKTHPALIDDYDRINHDYEQARTLWKFTQEPQVLTESGKDINTPYIQKRLADKSGMFRDKLGDGEFDALHQGFRRNAPPSEGNDIMGAMRRGGGIGHIGGDTNRMYSYLKLLAPTRETPNLSHYVGDPLRSTPNFASKAAFTLLDPHLATFLNKLQPSMGTPEKPNASNQ